MSAADESGAVEWIDEAAAPAPAKAKKTKKRSQAAAAPAPAAAPAMAAAGFNEIELSNVALSVSPSDEEPSRIASPSMAGRAGAPASFPSFDAPPRPRQNTRSPDRPLRLHTESKDDDSAAASAHDLVTPVSHSAQPELFERHIEWSAPLSAQGPVPGQYPSNLVVTSRYTAINFLPMNLWEQLSELSNLYFLFIGILQAIPAISTTGGIPTIFVPLLFIITVSAFRAAIEDHARHVLDEREGAKKYMVFDAARGAFVTRASKDIVVGDIIQMVFGTAEQGVSESPAGNSEGLHDYPASGGGGFVRTGRDPSVNYSASFPADLLFLSSSHEKGHCFVETASLDGESNLKVKSSLALTHNALWRPMAGRSDGDDGGAASSAVPSLDRLRALELAVDIEGPNSQFDSCKGVATLHPRAASEVRVALKAENLLLRGTELRNTAFVLGMVVYTGPDTKIRRNVASSAAQLGKRSALMKRVNHLLIFMLCFQLLLCFFAALLCFSWTDRSFDRAWYLHLTEAPALAALRSFFSWLIILAQLVPISLLVSNEVVKAAQARFIAWDRSIYDAPTDQPAVVRNSQLHEDLGQVSMIFSDKTGTLTQNRMEFRVGFVGTTPFGSPDSEIARRVARRMEERRREQQLQAGGGDPAAMEAMQREQNLTWTERVAKLEEQASVEEPAFNDAERDRMLTALWGPKRRPAADASSVAPAPADPKLAAEIRTFLTHMAISNTITPELKTRAPPPQPLSSSNKGRGWLRAGAKKSSRTPAEPSPESAAVAGLEEYVLNFSSPDELALCQFAAACGFQFASRGKDGVQLRIDKKGYGDGRSEVEMYQSLATLDFNSKRKRVTVLYLRDNRVHVMCKGADANVMPLIAARTPEAIDTRQKIDAQLNDMAARGLRTLVVAGCTLPQEWWFGDGSSGSGRGMAAVYRSINLPDRGAEKGHHRGECRPECRICAGLLHIESAAQLRLLGATAIEDKLQPLVPEAIADFLRAGIKVWMLTGDKRETAKNIALAVNLIDPDQESSADLLGSLDTRDLNRVIEVTGDWVTLCASQDRLRAMFDLLDSGGDVVDGVRTGYISRQELQLFLVGMRVPHMEDDTIFQAQWMMVQNEARNDASAAAAAGSGGPAPALHEGRINFTGFCSFIRNLQPSHLKAVQTDIELGLRKARLIAGDGTEEEKRERLEKCPITLVVEGEAFSVFFPAAPKRRGAQHGARPPSPSAGMWERWGSVGVNGPNAARRAHLAEQDADDFGSPEVLLLRETFFELASLAKSVICCRLTPSQKGRIVEEFGKRGVVTLAIGDGGNDELMIRRASIGIGITGVEGTAASRAADIAIGQFRFLHTLLFVHGLLNYRRISKLTLYVFYKVAMVAIAMYLFLFYSAASGQQYFNDAIYILFNIAFTALPILVLAIFDTAGLSKESLENHPQVYLSVAHGGLFNDSLFFGALIRATWSTLWVFGVAWSSVGVEDIASSDGQTHGLWFTSTLVYTGIVLLVTVRILFEAQSINGFLAFVVALSFVGYFPVVLLCSSLLTVNPNLYGVFSQLFGSAATWMTLLLCVAVPLLVDVIAWSWQRMVSPTFIDVLQERQRMSKNALRQLDHSNAVAANASAARVRTRAVPQLTQQQKDDALLAKVRRALTQAHQESAHAAASGESSESAARRAEALVYTMTRLQNLSGANLDATPQRNILSLYEVAETLTPAQQAALREKEEALAADAQKQHQLNQIKEAAAARAAEEARQRLAAERRREQEERQQAKQRRRHVRRRSSDAAGASANELVLQLADEEEEEDEELSDAEPEHLHALEEGSGQGRGRVHQQAQLGDEEFGLDEEFDGKLSISDNALETAEAPEERKER